MSKKKTQIVESVKPNALWEITTEMQINGRNVKPGTELKITGWSGRYIFIKYVKTEKGKEWVDVWGGSRKMESFRSCSLEMIKTVHAKNKTEQHLAKEYKKKRKVQLAQGKQTDINGTE